MKCKSMYEYELHSYKNERLMELGIDINVLVIGEILNKYLTTAGVLWGKYNCLFTVRKYSCCSTLLSY